MIVKESTMDSAGILGLCLVGVVVGIVAWVFGDKIKWWWRKRRGKI